MKNVPLTKQNAEKKKKMTLKSYYSALADQKTPLQAFVAEVSERCGVSEQTVRNWCLYGIKPQSYAYVKVLMEVTGLEEDELWQ